MLHSFPSLKCAFMFGNGNDLIQKHAREYSEEHCHAYLRTCMTDRNLKRRDVRSSGCPAASPWCVLVLVCRSPQSASMRKQRRQVSEPLASSAPDVLRFRALRSWSLLLDSMLLDLTLVGALRPQPMSCMARSSQSKFADPRELKKAVQQRSSPRAEFELCVSHRLSTRGCDCRAVPKFVRSLRASNWMIDVARARSGTVACRMSSRSGCVRVSAVHTVVDGASES